MQRKFLSNLSFLIFVNMVVKPVYIFGIDITIQNVLGEEAYGLYFSVFKYAMIFGIMLDFGIENFNRREIARDRSLVNKYFSNFITLKLILGAIYFITAVIGGLLSGYNIVQLKLLFLVLFNEILRGFIMYLRANLGGLQKFRTDSVFSVLDRGLMIVICGILLLNQGLREGFRIEWFVLSQTAAYIISASLALYFVYKEVSHIKLGLNKSFNLSLIRQLLPYALLLFQMAIYTHIDPFLLERILPDGTHQAGIFAQGFRLLEACANYSYLFAVILLPLFSNMLKKGESIEQLLRLSFFLIMVPSILIVIGSNIFSNEIIIFLYHNTVEVPGAVFGTVMFSLLGLSTTYVYGTLLTANGNLKQLNIIAFIGVVVSISLNAVLIPKYKAYGASLANMGAQLITAILQIMLAHYIFKIRVRYHNFLVLIFYFVAMYIAGMLIYKFLPFDWAMKFLLYLLCAMVVAVLFIFKDFRQFYRFLVKER